MQAETATRHTEECSAQRSLAGADLAAYAASWPGYCTKCDGYGGRQYYDSDTGGTGVDTCTQCVDEGICPRCGVAALDDDGELCSACGWTWGAAGAPEVGCICPEPIFTEPELVAGNEYEVDYATADFAYDAARERERV